MFHLVTTPPAPSGEGRWVRTTDHAKIDALNLGMVSGLACMVAIALAAFGLTCLLVAVTQSARDACVRSSSERPAIIIAGVLGVIATVLAVIIAAGATSVPGWLMVVWMVAAGIAGGMLTSLVIVPSICDWRAARRSMLAAS